MGLFDNLFKPKRGEGGQELDLFGRPKSGTGSGPSGSGQATRTPDNRRTGGRGRENTGPASQFSGEVDDEGNITPPDYTAAADQYIGDIQSASDQEIARNETALDTAREEIQGREDEMMSDIHGGKVRARVTRDRNLETIEEGRERVEDLPDRVQEDLQGIRQEFQAQVAGSSARVESIGREAADAALNGKNAAAQAAVAAQQNATRDAIARINSDPNIPPSRKAAMINQVQTQSSMSIATTVGANIKDFTQMQVGALSETMKAVGSIEATGLQVGGQLSGIESQEVANAHTKVAEINHSFDQMEQTARENFNQTVFQHNQLQASYAQMGDQMSLALLGEESRVAGMPVDAAVMDYGMVVDALNRSFSADMQRLGYETMQEYMEQNQQASTWMTLGQSLAQFVPGPAGAILGGIASIGGSGVLGNLGGGQ